MKKVLVDCRISKKCENTLFSLGYESIKLLPSPSLPSPIASHPDMLIFPFGDALICTKEYYSIAKKELESTEKRIILSDETVGYAYPHDILLNAAPVGEYLFGKLDHISSYIKALPYKAYNINQGYAKCSCCTVSGKAIITSDPSLEAAAFAVGIDVLKISEGHILLPGYDTGFIGGASGVSEEFVTFCGNIDTHPNAESIKDFCKKHGKKPISLSDEPLFDAGTLFFF